MVSPVLMWAVLAQVEEDLDRATCLISDGDIASLLPSKAHGNFELDLVGFGLLVFGSEAGILFLMFCTSIGFAGAFLKMFLGPVNLRATRKEVQLKVKEEYNSYRVCVEVYY